MSTKKTYTDLYTSVGEYSLNARIQAAIEGQEGLSTVMDICRRNDSGELLLRFLIDQLPFI